MTHPWLVLESPAKVRQELAHCNAALEDVLGMKVRYFRPPHGARRPDVLRIAREFELAPVMWNVIGYDWKPENDAPAIHRHIERGICRNRRAGRGSNIVLHDGGQAGIGMDRSATVGAVQRLFATPRNNAANFITADQTAPD
jgi:peptidoglycan/xylan/chitin deacetylase (PgdA/CDA1 family)